MPIKKQTTRRKGEIKILRISKLLKKTTLWLGVFLFLVSLNIWAIIPTQAAASISAISAGTYHSLVITSDGSVWAWGWGSWGQLGNGTTIFNSSTPVQVKGPGGVGFLADIIGIAAGGGHSLALKSDGTVWAWGSGNYGQLGNGTTTDRTTPVQVKGSGGVGFLTGIIGITAGGSRALALKSDGTVWAWGYNDYGQLGDGTTTNRLTPVQVKGPGGVDYLTGIISISAEPSHSLALKSDGTVWAWGSGNYGQMGNGTTTATNTTPVQVKGSGGVGFLTGVTAIFAGGGHSLALKSDSTVWAWGLNDRGQLGDATVTNRSTPVQVKGSGGVDYLTGIIGIAAGGGHSLALKSDGTVRAWGSGNYGQMGNGTTTATNTTPVQVKGPGGVGFLTGVIGINSGWFHSLALKSDNTAWAWGNNEYGQLGDRTTTNRLTPVQVQFPNDIAPPVLSFTSPASGAVLGGASVSVTLTATDATAPITVTLTVPCGTSTPTSASISSGGTASFAWNATSCTNGNQTLSATAADSSSPPNTSAPVTRSVTVSNDTTAPTVSAVTPISTNINQSTTFQATYSDNVGVTSCNLFTDSVDRGAMTLSAPGGANGTASKAYTYSTSGTHTAQVKCKDAVNNQGIGALTNINVVVPDTIAPTVGLVTPTSANVNQSTTFQATYSDNVGVTSCNLFTDSIDRGAMTLSAPGGASGIATRSYTYTVAGNHTAQVRCTDAAGNNGAGQTTSISVITPDSIPPITTPSAWKAGGEPYIFGNFSNQDILVNLSCVDQGQAASGCRRTYYCQSTGVCTPGNNYYGPFGVAVEGANSICFRSEDNAGNLEPTQCRPILIDKTAPVSTLTLDPSNPNGLNQWYTDAVSYNIKAIDEGGSGLDKTFVCVDQANACDPEAVDQPTGTIIEEGVNFVRSRSRDLAGNFEDLQVEMVSIDFHDPVATLEPLLEFDGDGFVDLTWNAEDLGIGSGLYRVQVLRNGENIFESPGTRGGYLDDLSDQSNDGMRAEYIVRAVDYAGRFGESASQSTTIDLAPPTTPILKPLPLFTAVAEQVVTWFRSIDTVSGVDFYNFSRNGTVNEVDEPDPLGTATEDERSVPDTLSEGELTTYQVSAVDQATPPHESGASDPARTILDSTPPVTTATFYPLEPDGKDSWYVSPLVVELNCSDEVSGCAGTSVTVDGNNFDYTGPFMVATEGKHEIRYRSVDVASNQEEEQAQNVRLDLVSPEVSFDASSDSDGDGVIDAVKLICRDSVSGCESIKWRFIQDGGSGPVESFDCSGTLECETDLKAPAGFFSIEFIGFDVAGHMSVYGTRTITGDACSDIAGLSAPTEYVLEILDFISTSDLISAPRVFVGNNEVSPDSDGRYHVPLKDETGFITDETNYETLPPGVWVIDRKSEGLLVAGIWGKNLKKGEVMYNAKATLDGGIFVRKWKGHFEKDFDVDGGTITAVGKVHDEPTLYRVEYADLQGCPVGDRTIVELHVKDQQKSGVCGQDDKGKTREDCTLPLVGSYVKVFDRGDTDFIAAFGKDPKKEKYDQIFAADIGLVGQCVTGTDGECLAPEPRPGRFLVIAELSPEEGGVSVYQGKKKNFHKKVIAELTDEDNDDDIFDFKLKDLVRVKKLRFEKTIDKNGNVKYKPEDKDEKPLVYSGRSLIAGALLAIAVVLSIVMIRRRNNGSGMGAIL